MIRAILVIAAAHDVAFVRPQNSTAAAMSAAPLPPNLG
jgi:hypothetical protein